MKVVGRTIVVGAMVCAVIGVMTLDKLLEHREGERGTATSGGSVGRSSKPE